jgi:cardiolipin synthase
MQEGYHKKSYKHANSGHHILGADKLELTRSGNDYFDRVIAIINRSTQTLHLQTYIFIDDSTGKTVIEAMVNAAKRGVKVYVLVDAFGSFGMSREGIETMEKNGIKFRTFSPLFVHRKIRFGRRLHHKILLADEKEALIGGINIEDKYHLTGDNSPWLDYAIYFTGPVCQYVKYICENTWSGRAYTAHMKRKVNNHTAGIPITIRQNDWLFKKEGISKGHRMAMKNAKQSITIVGSYFLPGRRIRKILKDAAVRNVRIKLILQGVSDVSLIRKASVWWYAWMFRNHIEIYEWTKTILHGKMLLIDEDWASVGSYNINHLSDYASIETNVYVHDKAFCHTVHEEIAHVISQSEKITESTYHNKVGVWSQFTCWLSFHTVRLLFSLQFALLSRE